MRRALKECVCRRILLTMACLSVAIPSTGQDVAVTNVTEDVLILHPADVRNLEIVQNVGANVTAVRTDDGWVIVDAFVSSEAAGIGRKLIEAQFPNLPVKYLINTHGHADHFRGNQCFRDACIIGHVQVENAIMTDYRRLTDKYGDYDARIAELTGKSKTAIETGSEETGTIKKDLLFWKSAKAFLEMYVPTPPSVQISSNTLLRVGHKTFEILFFGKAHTDNDLVVLDRDDRLLIMGDLLCYRKCYIMNAEADAMNWIALLQTLIDRRDEFDYVVPGHGGVVVGVNALLEQREYLNILSDAVWQARQRGSDLEHAKEEIRMEQYSDYMMYDRVGLDVEAMWIQFDRKE